MTNVTYALHNQVATITFDDGKVNSFSMEMVQQLNKALDQAEKDEAVVILAGKTGMFSAGFHLPTMMEGIESRNTLAKTGVSLVMRMIQFPLPIISACTGHAMALGAVILLNSDYRIGTKGDFKIGLNEVQIGLAFSDIFTDLIEWRLNPIHRQRSMLLAEILSPEKAVEFGYLDELADAEGLLQQAQLKGEQLAKTLDMNAFAKSKISLHRTIIANIEEQLASCEHVL